MNDRQKKFFQDYKRILIERLGEQEALKEMQHVLNFIEANIPLKFIDFSFERYDEENGDARAKKKIKEYADQVDRMLEKGTGLYLCGDKGRGKTILACEALKSAIRKGHTAYFVAMSEVVELFTEAWFSNDARRFLIEKVRDVEFLIIDEFLNEYAGKVELLRSAFNSMLRPRSNNLCCTIITSNKPMKEIETVYNELLGSLVKESLREIVFMPGVDYRTVLERKLYE